MISRKKCGKIERQESKACSALTVSPRLLLR
jgi:hypothetical protein